METVRYVTLKRSSVLCETYLYQNARIFGVEMPTSLFFDTKSKLKELKFDCRRIENRTCKLVYSSHCSTNDFKGEVEQHT